MAFDETKRLRLLSLLEPHPNKSRWQRDTDELVRGALARLAELESRESSVSLQRWGTRKPAIGRYFILYEVWDEVPMLVERDSEVDFSVVTNGLEVVGDACLDDTMERTVKDQSLWCYVPDPPVWKDDYTDGTPTWDKPGQSVEGES